MCGRKWEVGPKIWWGETDGRWEMGSQNWEEVRGCLPKQVRDRFAPAMGGRWEAETPATDGR